MHEKKKFIIKLLNLADVFLTALKLGLTSFGGPIAHLGFFHHEYVVRRRWLDEQTYVDLVALCQILPGPASSQLGISIGTMRAGLAGGVAAWLGFTLPSAVLMALFAYFLQGFAFGQAPWMHGLKLVAVAIVAHAIAGMWQKLVTGRLLAVVAAVAMMVLMFWQSALSQIILIVVSGVVGVIFFRQQDKPLTHSIRVPVHKAFSIVCLALFFGLLIALPVLRQMVRHDWLALGDSFYRSGSLVFGGGHVILPLLEEELVPAGLISKENFLAGYGAAQAVPGPLFTLAAYLGVMAGGLPGALISLLALFLPAWLLIIGVLPFWDTLRRNSLMKGAMTGINAAVVGILMAALYHPLFTSSIHSRPDAAIAVFLFTLLAFLKMPPWVIVLAGAAVSSLVAFFIR